MKKNESRSTKTWEDISWPHTHRSDGSEFQIIERAQYFSPIFKGSYNVLVYITIIIIINNYRCYEIDLYKILIYTLLKIMKSIIKFILFYYIIYIMCLK
jgi:hypothetical protein